MGVNPVINEADRGIINRYVNHEQRKRGRRPVHILDLPTVDDLVRIFGPSSHAAAQEAIACALKNSK